MASDEQFSLCWNNFHANMSAGFHGLLSRGDLVDVTLAAEGRLLQAHKLVLSVCSPYFQEMFKMNPTQHPIVFLKDVSHSALRDLLQFMYQGEVNVKQEELASFISTAEQLQVKGLTGNQNEESSTPSKPKPTSRPGPRSSQQRQSVMTKLETDLDSKPSTTPVAVKRPNRPSIASNNSSSSQSGPAKRKCVDPLEAGPSGSAKEEFVTIPDEDENNAVAPKMEPEFVNESMWDDDDDGANNEETNFGEDDSNMEMTGFDGSTTGDGNITGGGEGGAVGDAQVQDAKSERKKLRDNHRDSLKRMKATRSGQAATNLNTWRYAELMEFLLPYMKNRSRSTNLNSSDIRSSATPESSVAQDDEDTNNSEISVVPTKDTINNTEASAPQGGKTQTRKRTADGDFIELLKEMEENHQKRQEERDLRRTMTKTQEKGAIDLFLESMAITIKTMPMWMQNRVKKKIFLIVSDAEEELENYSTCVTPDSVNNTFSANYGYTTSRDPVNNNLPAAVAGSSRSANYVYTLPEAAASRSNNTTYHGYSSSERFEPSPLHDYDN